MRLHPLFPIVKTTALYLAPIKSYSKNTHAPFILKWAIIQFHSTNFKLSKYIISLLVQAERSNTVD